MTRSRIVRPGEAMVEEPLSADGTLTTLYGEDALKTTIHLSQLGCNVVYAMAVGCDG